MLSIDFCRRLKDAGFPQEGHERWWGFTVSGIPGDPKQYWSCCRAKHGVYACPNIEELLAALGDEFEELNQAVEKTWVAFGKSHVDKCTFPTAEDALAHLYIATHSHP